MKSLTFCLLETFQKQRIKIAFAEGYLAGNTNADGTPKSGRAMKYLKVSSVHQSYNRSTNKTYRSYVFQQLLIIVVFLGILSSLFSSTNDRCLGILLHLKTAYNLFYLLLHTIKDSIGTTSRGRSRRH